MVFLKINDKSGKMLKMRRKYIISAFCCFLTACQTGQTEYRYPEKVNGRYEMPSEKTAGEKNDTVFDKKYLTFTFGGKEEKDASEPFVKKPKNPSREEIRPLWPAVLPVLSRYPIALVQQNELVMTEWFSDPENPRRQLKINAVKIGADVRITVLCRRKDKDGGWINQKNDATLADKIKNDIVKQSFNH